MNIVELEHDTQIVPLGSDPNHCQRCRCAHEGHTGEVIDITTLCGFSRHVCGTCGTTLEDE